MEGTSLEFQEDACREYARTQHISVLKVFVEQGESAKFADRTQLLELVDFCRTQKGSVQVLIVWKVDRFARNVSDHFSVKATLLKYGVRVASVTEPIDQNPEGKLMETILAGFAQFDNDIRALRTVQGMHKKLVDGIFPWKAPLGYRSADRKVRYWGLHEGPNPQTDAYLGSHHREGGIAHAPIARSVFQKPVLHRHPRRSLVGCGL